MAYGHTTLVSDAGAQVINYTHSSAVVPGDVIVVGTLTLVAQATLAASQRGAYIIAGAVVNAPKATGVGTAFTVGTRVYWDAADVNVQNTADSGTNKHFGVVCEQNVDADAFVRVLKTAQV